MNTEILFIDSLKANYENQSISNLGNKFVTRSGSRAEITCNVEIYSTGSIAGTIGGAIGMAVATYQFIRCLENLPREDMSVYVERGDMITPWDGGNPLSVELIK